MTYKHAVLGETLELYIRWEMTPTSIGDKKQASISGGSQSPI